MFGFFSGLPSILDTFCSNSILQFGELFVGAFVQVLWRLHCLNAAETQSTEPRQQPECAQVPKKEVKHLEWGGESVETLEIDGFPIRYLMLFLYRCNCK